ncbi:hypothetical protein Sjap_002503 [Stephania japonica]|uniref:Uncharacterized protein n=1 Tax=Stephania japonica TaxID=461633 RepID=A0AAP0KM15_9MAGN
MDGRSTLPSETRQAGIVIRSPQATVSLEDRLTAQEVQMTEVLRILRDHGAAISEMAASLTIEPPERQRLYQRLHEGNDRRGFASTKRRATSSESDAEREAHRSVSGARVGETGSHGAASEFGAVAVDDRTTEQTDGRVNRVDNRSTPELMAGKIRSGDLETGIWLCKLEGIKFVRTW